MRTVKCRLCGKKMPKGEAFLFVHETKTGKEQNRFYCSQDEYDKEQKEIYYWRECQYEIDNILGYPVVNNKRNKMLTEILDNGYSREELYNCIKEQSNYIAECLNYRKDIDTEFQKLCYMFTIIKGSIKDITERNKKQLKMDKNIYEIDIDEVVVPISNESKVANKRKSLFEKLGG